MVKTGLRRNDMLFSEVIQMDLRHIGKFIAELRKEQNYTQEQLGEKLGVTNKTISRWETGTYLPPAEALLSMSELFSVSINEILSGKRLGAEDYKEAAEENLKQAITVSSFNLKERVAFFKKKWLKEHIALLVFIGLILIAVFAVGFILKSGLLEYLAVVLLVISYCVLNNLMMAYVERNAYDGSGRI